MSSERFAQAASFFFIPQMSEQHASLNASMVSEVTDDLLRLFQCSVGIHLYYYFFYYYVILLLL